MAKMGTTKGYWNLDRVLMRLKDMIIICGAVYGIFVVGAKYYPLPGDVAAHASTLKDHEKRIQKVEDGFSNLKEIKELLVSWRAENAVIYANQR